MMLFAFFGLWGTVAVGAGAVSVPIIIHLLNRRRYRIVTWAAMRFLLAAQKQNTRRLRLEQLILLLVRVGVIALVVFAMAAVMPWAENVWAYFWPEGGRPGAQLGARMHHVIVLDGSLSMNLSAEGQPLFERARQLAIAKIKQSPAGDGFSVLLVRDNPAWIVGEASHHAGRVIREVEAIRAGHGNSALAPTLNMVSAKLSEASGRFPSQTVYFFTDLQRTTWAGLPPSDPAPDGDSKAKTPWQDIQERARTVFVDVGRDDVDNVAVADLSIDEPFVTTGMEAPITAVIQHFGKEKRTNVRVELLVGKAREAGGDAALSPRVVGHELVPELRAGDRSQLGFRYKFPEPGTYAVQVRVEGDDLELDNVRSAVVTVKDTIPVLLVNGKPSLDRFDQATEYVRLALNPWPRGAEPKWAPLRPRVVKASLFPDVPEDELLNYDLICLCDVGQFGPGDLRRLDAHVRRGGGLMIALGGNALDNLDVYNRLFFKNEYGLLPAQLFKKVAAPAEHFFSLNAQEDQFLEPPLRAFKNDDDRISLKTGRFRMYVEAKPAGDAKARTVMTFMPELAVGAEVEFDKSLATSDPAILEWNPPLGKQPLGKQPLGKQDAGKGKLKGQPAARYRGKVVLVTTTLNMDWNTWPGSPSFGAMMQELARLAVAGRLREHAAHVGAILEEFLPAAGGELDAAIQYPETIPAIKPQKTRTQLVEDTNVFRWADTDVSGLYRVVLGSGPQEIPFAVNVPATTPDQRGSESNLARVDKAKLSELFQGWNFQLVRDAREAIVGGGPVNLDAKDVREPIGPDIAYWALLLVLVLLFAEVILAWRFGHFSAVHGAGSEPSTSLVMPSAVAIIAGTLFVILGFVLVHALATGDFLGFLPRILRNWVERLVGAPSAPAGEESRWELGGRPVFFDGIHDGWYLGLLGVAAVALVFFTYRAEGPAVNRVYKLLLGGLRVFLIWLALGVLLPQRDWRIDRQGWPDVVVLIDTSASMGEADHYQNDALRERIKQLGEMMQKPLKERLPARIAQLEADIETKRPHADDSPEAKTEFENLEKRVKDYRRQLEHLNSPSWRPTRLQIVQGLLAQAENDWLKRLVNQRRMKVHVYQLDMQGRAIKLSDKEGAAGEITELSPAMIDRAHRAVVGLEAEGTESRLGTALRQVIDQYRGAALSAVVMLTDGVTTRDETIGQVGEYAAQKAIPLFFVGIGDDHEVRDLKLHDLVVDDVVYLNDRVVFEARMTGKGYKKDSPPFSVLLKVKENDGKETILDRVPVKVNPQGKAERFRLAHKVDKVGRKQFIIEIEAPKPQPGEKNQHPVTPRLERTIEVIDAKMIKVLYVEGQPRYEFRYVKFLLERESPDAKKNKSVDLKTYLVDADPDFAQTDKTALPAFPPTQAELSQFDVIILGDVDAAKLGMQNMQNLVDFVRGEDAKGKKLGKGGGGLLLIAGALYNPHSYKDTPLKDVIPIEPGTRPVEGPVHDKKLRLELTPMGRMHPVFRFSSNDNDNMGIMQRLAPLYWWSGGYRLKPLAEVLAVHPELKGDPRDPAGHDGRLPLVVQQFVGAGRSLFFGFDETWRWRLREDEVHFNNFWIQTVRYLARARPTRTDLRLDRQTPYRLGEPIKVTVRFPDSTPIPGITDTKAPKGEVKVVVEYRPPAKQDVQPEAEVQTIQLAKLEGSWGTFEHVLGRTREGKYRFRLMAPDVSKFQPDGEKPSAEATVELPPGELDRLRMNQLEMTQAAEATQGKFFSVTDADDLVSELPSGFQIAVGSGASASSSGGVAEFQPGGRVSLGSPMPAVKLWNQWWIFAIIMFLLTSEWLLRKRKHLL
ncbi:MAG: VWA domain-containing protein [Gemmataceae bacterium]|nr:VWA domain-containing protein [Gemmataceae bacterium]